MLYGARWWCTLNPILRSIATCPSLSWGPIFLQTSPTRLPSMEANASAGTWWDSRTTTRRDRWAVSRCKYYQHPPDQVQEVSEYNSNATYLADSDQIMTLNAMETDDTSISASLRDNLQELEHSVPEWEPETQSIHPKWLEHHQSGHLVKDPSCQYAWRKPAVRSIIGASTQIDIQALCIVILQHLNPQQMVTSIV